MWCAAPRSALRRKSRYPSATPHVPHDSAKSCYQWGMTNTIDTAAAKAIRSFAVAHNELQFAHLCTAALQGEEWAVRRIGLALGDIDQMIADGATYRDGRKMTELEILLDVIRSTDTTRPDGAIAKSMMAP